MPILSPPGEKKFAETVVSPTRVTVQSPVPEHGPFQPENTDMAHIPPAGAFEYLKTQAVSRLYLDNFANIQSSWVTQGEKIGQIAAAFLGLGDQIGYTRLVEALLGLPLDKSHQFTDWLERPLSAEQLHYAAADVRHLLPAWHLLEERLTELGRMAWVEEESARLAREAARRLPPEEVWAKVKGAERLSPVQLGRLREVAAWRERTALDTNTPPSWLIKDRPLLELARTPPDTPGELLRRRDVSERTVRRYGREILNALARGGREPLAVPRPAPRLAERYRTWVAVLQGLIQARCREAELAPRLVASRDDAETLVRWWIEGDRSAEPGLPLLSGWRRELAGQAALDWLAGETAVAADPRDDSGLRLVPLPGDEPPGEGE